METLAIWAKAADLSVNVSSILSVSTIPLWYNGRTLGLGPRDPGPIPGGGIY